MYSHSKAMSRIPVPGKILWLGIKKMKKLCRKITGPALDAKLVEFSYSLFG
jgi:hypothetical protein